MSEIDLTIEGMDDIIKKLEEIGSKANKLIDEALQKGAEPILNDLKTTPLIKDRSGDLRKSMKISKAKTTRKGRVVWVGDVDREAIYGWYVEYGHSRATAKPFLRTAYNSNKQEAQRIIKETLREGLKEWM